MDYLNFRRKLMLRESVSALDATTKINPFATSKEEIYDYEQYTIIVNRYRKYLSIDIHGEIIHVSHGLEFSEIMNRFNNSNPKNLEFGEFVIEYLNKKGVVLENQSPDLEYFS